MGISWPQGEKDNFSRGMIQPTEGQIEHQKTGILNFISF